MSSAGKITTAKLVLAGPSHSGKTCLLRRWVDDHFTEDVTSTVGVEFSAKIVTIDGEKVKLCIWDTAGQERYATVTRSYMRGAVGALLVYDVTNRSTFDAVPKWLAELRELAGDSVVVMLIGNKTDLCQQGEGNEDRREVPHTKASIFAQENGLMHMETSAATGDFVPEAFLRVARTAVQRMRQQQGGAAGGPLVGGGNKSRLLDDDGNAIHEAAGSPTRVNLREGEEQQQQAGDENPGMCSRC